MKRRLFMARSAVAAAIAPREIARATERQMGASSALKDAASEAAKSVVPTVDNKAWEVFRILDRKPSFLRQQDDYRREMAGGFDPNIAALRSVSLQHKIQMQTARTIKLGEERHSFMRQLMKKAGLSDEDLDNYSYY